MRFMFDPQNKRTDFGGHRIPGSGESRTVKKRNATQFDTIRIMRDVAFQSSQNPYFKYLIDKYQISPQDLHGLFLWVHHVARFKGDTPEKQTIRTGQRSLIDGLANCVDYCVLLSSFLINMGVPHFFRMAGYDRDQPQNFSHIYIVLDNDEQTALDCVIGQAQNGDEVNKPQAQRIAYFGHEVPYIYKYDLKII